MYCPRRFALLEVNNDWAENAFVVKANLMHEHVHDGSHDFSSKGLVAKSAVAVYNDDYDIFGVADCAEFEACKGGVHIDGLEGEYRVKIVEYKPKAPKNESFNETDAIQVFAQKLCADYIWKCDCEGYIYYSESRKRVKLPFDDDAEREKYRRMLERYLGEMREILKSGIIPEKRKGQKCTGCSLEDICFPKSASYGVRESIMSMNEEESK